MSVVLQLIREARHQVPIGAPFGVRWRGSAQVALAGMSHQVMVTARIDHKGRRREQLLLDGVRVDRSVLLRLTCTETECPQARFVRAQWDAFHRRTPRHRTSPLQARPLIEEFALVVGAQQCTARPARFTCFTHCPNRAHPALLIEKTGYDLFEDGVYVGGGLLKSRDGARPRLPTLEAAKAFVLARQLEAMAMLGRLRMGSKRDEP
ncbi:MAG TPA: hypothetical protein VFU71_12060 [Burkholderiaceae bacterium]|nr:hypothetical protein [Burkholderiaceae bacterium]